MTSTNSKEVKDRDYSIKFIKTKKIPIILKFKRKDGSTMKIKATKIVKNTQSD